MPRILVVEDEPTILANILQILEIGGYDAIGAENGLEGIELARRSSPDLIISDIMMPDADGYDVLLNIRNDAAMSMTPFIFLTALADKAAMRQGFEFGADDYLTKPFTASELLVAVSTRLERHSAIVREYNRKVEDLRGNILHMLPHELRTPLNVILGYSEFLITSSQSMGPEKITEIAERINQGGRRLNRLIENFLLYTQIKLIQAEPAQFQALRGSRITHPKAIIEQLAIQQAQQLGRDQDLQMDIENADGTSVCILEDSFKKIVEELVDNGFKFTKSGKPVQVRAAPVDGTYIVQVNDYGRGMTAQQIADIDACMQFERGIYEQQGTGVGLSIVKGLIDLFAGTLTIESTPGQGTSVTASLPMDD
jgi:two-component system, sensor histidine kinase and response regulator